MGRDLHKSHITCDFEATQDTYIKLKNDTENYGSCNELIVDREKTDLHRILLQFDISSLPSSATITNAEVRLYTNSGNNFNISIFQIGASDVWSEGSACGGNDSANWNNRTGSTPWSIVGVVGDHDAGTPLHTINGNSNGIHSWPITTLTQNWHSGSATNNGVMIGSQDGGGNRTIEYESTEAGGANPPILRVTFEITDVDSDYDGVGDLIDIDDDNDGILDTIECDKIVNPPLQDPDFEALDILTLDGGPTDVVATSGIWKGDASHIPHWQSSDPTNNHLEIWHNTQGAGNDVGGQAYTGSQWAEVNATTNDGIYQDITTTPGEVLAWTFAHRKRTSYAGSPTEDVVRLLLGDPSGTMTSQGDFTSAADASWTVHSGQYTVPPGQSTTRLTFTVISVASGSTSSGNFIDNVQLYVLPTDCEDKDNDGIADYLDLDSDNDGIPDIVEAGHANLSNGLGRIDLALFTDSNLNGMHDALESTSPLDSDGDGTPNYLDLDSDNDTVFDVDEARTERYVGPTLVFENGDGDVNGDGVGDGPESENFRPTSGCDGLGDGILDIYDYGTGTNEYGNLIQGTGPLYVKDTDGDGIPDYIDIQSDGSSFDISNSLYADLDANNDGLIDDTNDVDSDGILDLFDTNDTEFGSPRDLDQKLQIYFDGRNDYVQDASITSGWGEITLMGWIKQDPAATGANTLFGQSNFYLKLNASHSLEVYRNGSLHSSGMTITQNQWVHVGATYSDASDELIIYLNGKDVKTETVSGNLNSDTSLFTIGKQSNTDTEYFMGSLDEVRIFNKALDANELEKMVYQEVENNSGTVRGVIVPRDITHFISPTNIVPLSWSNLVRYYRLDTYKDDITDDLTSATVDENTGARLYNIKKLNTQTAPMPFVTTASGYLPNTLDKLSDGINGADAVTYDWSIVKVQHDDVHYDQDQKHLALLIDEQDATSNTIEFTVNNDKELNVSWYLELNGFLDLEGESQLIQGFDSELSVGSNGKLERDQQGTADTFTYNYWSSPVGITETGTNNFKYALNQVLHDGDDPAVFGSGYNGVNSTPVQLAHYWIWKYANNQSNNYSLWQHVRHTGSINAGEGFTMKGPGSGSITDDQNYVFKGKPNNGTITLPLNAGNDYLVGNPYPSAIDAQQFILDNGPNITGAGADPLISGTLYFWEHWGGGSHNLANYQGGYATYNFSGGVAAAAYGTSDPSVSSGGTPRKVPGRYIPVSQGFFVSGESNGTINFNNGQRVFQKENAASVFMRGTTSNQDNLDIRPKIRLNFSSVNTINRQLLLTIDENATINEDWGYDAPLNESQIDDSFWLIGANKYVIQGSDQLDADAIYPLGIKTASNGINTFSLISADNVDESTIIYIYDSYTDEYHDIRTDAFNFMLDAGEINDRFSLRFSVPTSNDDTLNVADEDVVNFNYYYSTARNKIVVLNPNGYDVTLLEMYNTLGQVVYQNQSTNSRNYQEYSVENHATGAYIIKLYTNNGTHTKKVIIK